MSSYDDVGDRDECIYFLVITKEIDFIINTSSSHPRSIYFV